MILRFFEAFIAVWPLQWNISVLFGWVRVALSTEHFEGVDETAARFAGADHGIDVAALRGDVGVGEALAELGDTLLARFVEHSGFALLTQLALACLGLPQCL